MFYNYNLVLNYISPLATVSTDLSVSYDSLSPTNQQKNSIRLFSGVARTLIVQWNDLAPFSMTGGANSMKML